MITEILIIAAIVGFLLSVGRAARADLRDHRRRRIEHGYTTDLREAYPVKSDTAILLEAIGL